jgi:hypothetical protein
VLKVEAEFDETGSGETTGVKAARLNPRPASWGVLDIGEIAAPGLVVPGL